MCEIHQLNEVFGIVVEVRGRPAGLHSRTKPRGQNEKGAMAGTIVEPSKTNHGEITLDLSAAAGPAVEERQGDDQEDSRTGRRTKEGEGWGKGRFGLGTSPAGALAHLPCCHTKGDTIRVGLKDGGFLFFFCVPFFPRLRGPGERCFGWEGRRGGAEGRMRCGGCPQAR